jgi:hypothetical protein
MPRSRYWKLVFFAYKNVLLRSFSRSFNTSEYHTFTRQKYHTLIWQKYQFFLVLQPCFLEKEKFARARFALRIPFVIVAKNFFFPFFNKFRHFSVCLLGSDKNSIFSFFESRAEKIGT